MKPYFLCNKLLLGWLPAFLLCLGTMSVSAQDLCQYSLHIDLPKGAHLSGVCVVRMEDNRGAMSVVNEFGIKVFDAVSPEGKGRVKLYNLIPLLDKWYVRRVLAKDMSAILCPHRRLPRRRTLERQMDGTLVLTNKRWKITYRFKPLQSNVTE